MFIKQRGFTLLEVMVAVFVMAIGLLGMAHLQLTSLKHNRSAESRTQAVLLAADMLDRMRANREAAQNGNYTLAIKGNPKKGNSKDDPQSSSTSSIADADLTEWQNNLSEYLPNGTGQIACGTFNTTSEFVCDVTVSWSDTENDGDAYGSLSTSTFTISGAM